MRLFALLLAVLLLATTSCTTLQELQQSHTAAQPIAFDITASLAQNLEAPTQTPLATQQLRTHMVKLANRIKGAECLRDGEVIKLELPMQTLFAPNDTLLSQKATKQLAPLRTLQSPRYNIAIVAHADNTGSDSYTQRLTQQRADAIVGWLMQEGATATSIATYPMGSTQPLYPNNSVENRAKNRRVEIYIIPTTELVEELRRKAKR